MKKALPSILILTTAVFLTGLAENIFIGILPDVAKGLSVTETEAASLISVFSLTYALYAPFAAVVAFRVNTKLALQISLAIFTAVNLVVMVPDTGLFVLNCSRVINAIVCAQISVSAVIYAVGQVTEEYRARAIGLVYLGISGSTFLGVPVGVWITHMSSWRATGLAMVLLGVVTICLVSVKLPYVKTVKHEGSPIRLFTAHLKDIKQLLGQLVSVLFIAGHFVLFTYLTSYSGNKGFSGPEMESFIFIIFGISGVAGGLLAGTFSDLIGRKTALITIPVLYILATFLLSIAEDPIMFFICLSFWAAASWSISPVVQSYLIGLARSPSDVVIGVNTSAMHLGVALGATVGGRLLISEDLSSLPWGAIGLVLPALVLALLSIALSSDSIESTEKCEKGIGG
ncbi:putative Major facilitator superfamily transporter [Shewanella benthica]|uniref:Putative Major facilitator superfamily transporter n=1 Tax=Shewanella benthica TaxID=43661 RepID=A0A330M326_9GAMM|nr:MFS transporter [Shewanella benthica]SQH74107.1 putative Major facilitator superfamily transporter [Shewanella benthica]